MAGVGDLGEVRRFFTHDPVEPGDGLRVRFDEG